MIEGNELRVSATSDPAKVGSAIAGLMKEEYIKNKYNAVIEVRAMGAGAVNQAVKAIITARGFLAPYGLNIYCIPAFSECIVDGAEKSLVKFIIKSAI